MYEIIKNDEVGTSLGLFDTLNFIKLQSNGCFTLTTEKEAQCIKIEDTIYQIFGKKIINKDYEKVIIIKRDSGNIITSINEIQDNTDALVVDQEYRLTLLELGVTE
jgi:hypothetical protein